MEWIRDNAAVGSFLFGFCLVFLQFIMYFI